MHLCLNPIAKLEWIRFDDEWVVYNQPSGETVVLDVLSAAGLMALESQSFDWNDLVACVANDLNLFELETLSNLLKERFQSLLAMSWVEKRS